MSGLRSAGNVDGPAAGRADPAAGRLVRSLRFRLLAGTLVGLSLALLLAYWGLAGLFREHVLRQFEASLAAQLDQLTARLEFDAAGQPAIDANALSDPRWSRPYSGLYWQVDRRDGAALQRGVLRSRSLWDALLQAPPDTPLDGSTRVREVIGPAGVPLLLLERSLRRGESAASGGGADDAQPAWRLLVAGDLQGLASAVARFNGVLAASLAPLLMLLGAAAVAQVAIGLAPLRALQQALAAVHAGRMRQLAGRFPVELQPLIDDFNRVLERDAEAVGRARTQAGNLAHAVKTPLAAIMQAAAEAERRPGVASGLPTLVREQAALAVRHVDWHLARARAAAALSLPGAATPLAPVVAGLVRVMERIHAGRKVVLDCDRVDPACNFAGEVEDLHVILGNLFDNACKWASRRVTVSAQPVAGLRPCLRVVVEDDGPGIAGTHRALVLDRGTRLDESVPGSGLGLAIVDELVGLYGGKMTLEASAAGGLRVEMLLPAAPSSARL